MLVLIDHKIKHCKTEFSISSVGTRLDLVVRVGLNHFIVQEFFVKHLMFYIFK